MDHHTAGEWPDWSDSILERIGAAGTPRDGVEVVSEPIFQYARRAEDSLDYLRNFDTGDGRVSIHWWSSIVFYSAFSVTAGDGVSAEALKESLADLQLLNESRGLPSPESARLFVYNFYARDDYPRLTSAALPMKDKLYIGPAWYVEEEEDGPASRDRYVIHERFPAEVIAFYPERGEPEEELWQKVSNSDGLIVVEKESRAWRRLGNEFAEYRDMELLLGGEADAALTVERCHMDDALLCAYNMGPVRGLGERLCMII
ncbi:MAG TPA: hypothetical protein VD861_10075 [Pyrinomonadaceae bacterium]|nr:hypothetical protein [Pyrinomonadaceae bacterium]